MLTGKLLEIACFNVESALLAQEAGADRIELCADYAVGGVTPPQQDITEARSEIKIPLHVIIRPRGGNFVYLEDEMQVMKSAITFCKTQKVDGIVFGALTETNEVDVPLCKELISLAGAMSLTFHRAIDQCPDIKSSVQQLIDLGIHRVLTSGAADTAVNGIKTLKQLQLAFGKQIIIMPGGGIRSSNILEVTETGCKEYHSAAITGQINNMADALEIKKIRQLFN